MLVGDPKQSIYRFRRADVTVWRGVQEDFEDRELGRVVTLEENFRSVPAIVGFVDASVGRVLDRPIAEGAWAEYEVKYQPLRAMRSGEGGAGGAARVDDSPAPATPAVELITLAGVAKTDAIEGCRRVEAAAIARRMRELIAAGAQYKDMAVLLTAWGSLDTYESALRAADIPTYALLAEGFYERREVLDLLLALETPATRATTAPCSASSARPSSASETRPCSTSSVRPTGRPGAGSARRRWPSSRCSTSVSR